ncbi:helix-turn-helix transcriptional regulator [Microbulbifer variabilis]|uniref:helix-turn-helix transcriptional regulator n=1 Tax=Microbulbifer variabilis TaxID=266805 RepID=UPI0003A14C2A|nr:AraC family transcriptional regulator [Microbulbifer variabilis]
MRKDFLKEKKKKPFIQKSINTGIWPIEERWSRWKQHLEEILPYNCELILKPHHCQEYEGEFSGTINPLTGDSFARAIFSGNSFHRNNHHLSDGYADYTVVYILSGRGAIQRGNHFIPMNSGGIYLVDLGQTIIHDLIQQSHVLLCRIPRKKIEKFRKGPGDNQPLVIDSNSGPGLLLRNYLLLLPRARQQSSFVSPETLFNPVAELAIACIEESRGKAAAEVETPQRLNVVFRQTCQLIQKYCCDVDLSAQQLAISLNISPSYLHRALRYHNTSYNSLLRRARVESASAQLVGSGRNASMLQVALNSGFNGTSQFSRAFKEEMGITASEFVKQTFAEKNDLLVLEE